MQQRPDDLAQVVPYSSNVATDAIVPKKLLLLRHAHAEPSATHGTDADRKLTAQGLQAAASLGVNWSQQQVHFDHIITSPAQRALATATVVQHRLSLSNQYQRVEQSLYKGTVHEVLTIMQTWPVNWQQVLIVSHLPLLQALLAHWIGKQDIVLPPCGFVCVQCMIDTWSAITLDTANYALLSAINNHSTH